MKKTIALTLFALTSVSFAQVADKPENVSPLLIGEKIPNVELKNTKNETVSTDKIFDKKTVVIFYRGGWCPYCNGQLSEMQEIEKEILAAGYQIVAISPDSSEKLNETIGKDKLNYQLYSDSDGSLSKAVGIAFTAPEKYGEMLGSYSGGKNTSILPVPTVYVTNEKGEIQFLYINPDYKTRLKGKLLLAVLNNL